MANYKTKNDLYSSSSIKMEWNEYVDSNHRMWDWDDDYDNYWKELRYSDSDDYSYRNYEYLPDKVIVDYISKRGLVCHKTPSSMGQRIDMNSIYSIEVMRHKKIDAI